MTAIFGILRHDQSPIPPGRMEQASQTLSRHAVDGLKIWQTGHLALGQALTRFWKNSPQTPQPEEDPERGLVLVSDARLDNRAELANRLQISTADLGEISDNRLILLAYRAWEADCLKYLLGDFVFALYDTRKNELFAARDPIGIRWLYYAASPRSFAFASDPAAVLDLMETAPRLDPQTLTNYLGYTTGRLVHQTLYENIQKLLPGNALRLKDGALSTWAYWEAENIKPLEIHDPREGAEYLGILLKQAVACRAGTVNRLGSHLSGGLDSSALTALATQITRETGEPDPFAFSWSPPLELRPLVEQDERVYVQRVADHLGLAVEFTHVPPRVDVLQEVSDPSILPLNSIRYEYRLMENAHAKDVRVLLSGWGGDELAFSRGIGYPSGLIQQGRWLALARYLKYQYGWRPVRWLTSLYAHGLYPLFPPKWQGKLPAELTWEPDPKKRWQNKIQEEMHSLLPAPGFLLPGFAALLERFHETEFKWIVPGLHACQRWYLTTLLSRVESWALWSARLGMRHAYPLLDQRIVEFALAMPEDWIYWQGGLRHFGRHAIREVLPASLFTGRDKQDRALFAHQKTLAHKQEIHTQRLAIFEAHWKTNPPAANWLDFDYLHQVLLEPPVTPEHPAVGETLPRNRIWQVLNFAFIDRRATLDENPFEQNR